MIIGNLIHPTILKTIASCGHGDRILICDGNYPMESNTNEKAEKIYLGLKPGIPQVTDVLESLNSELNFEEARVMIPDESISKPLIFDEFKRILDVEELSMVQPNEFYDTCINLPNLKLAINTGETRLFANILLTVAPVIKN